MAGVGWELQVLQVPHRSGDRPGVGRRDDDAVLVDLPADGWGSGCPTNQRTGELS